MKTINKTRIPWNLYNLLKGKIGYLFDGKQQDSHEFFLMLLAETNVPKDTASSITKIFEGKVTSTVTCSECNIMSQTTKSFTSLQIPIPGIASVYDALKKYFSAENVTYKCDRCKHGVIASKIFTITDAPKSLVLQLMRFSDSKKKDTRCIQIQSSIDVAQYFDVKHQKKKPRLVYKLAAIVNHKGINLNKGHCTAIAKSNADSWYEFDDSHVFQITKVDGNFDSDDAYMLFYEAVDYAKVIAKFYPKT